MGLDKLPIKGYNIMNSVAKLTGLIWFLFAVWLIIGIWVGTKVEAYRWRRSEKEGKPLLDGETIYKVIRK